MSTRYSRSLAPLAIEFSPSSRLRWLLVALAAAVAGALFQSGLPSLLRVVLAVLSFSYLLVLASRHTGWPTPASWRQLRWDGRGWLLQTRRGTWLSVELAESVIWPGLVALLFRTPVGGPIRVLLATDAMNAEAVRRLRLHLRCLPVHGQ